MSHGYSEDTVIQEAWPSCEGIMLIQRIDKGTDLADILLHTWKTASANNKNSKNLRHLVASFVLPLY